MARPSTADTLSDIVLWHLRRLGLPIAESVLVSRGTVSAGESAPISQICSVAVDHMACFSARACPSSVIDGLDDMIRRMQQIPGGWARPDSRALVQDSCVQLVETLERALSSWFEDDDGAVAGLHGEHYKLIGDMTASTPRPSPLINDEAARQVSVLERLRAKVTARLKRLAWSRSQTRGHSPACLAAARSVTRCQLRAFQRVPGGARAVSEGLPLGWPATNQAAG